MTSKEFITQVLKIATVATKIPKITSTPRPDKEKINCFSKTGGTSTASFDGQQPWVHLQRQLAKSSVETPISYVQCAVRTGQTASEPLPGLRLRFNAITLVLWESVRCSWWKMAKVAGVQYKCTILPHIYIKFCVRYLE